MGDASLAEALVNPLVEVPNEGPTNAPGKAPREGSCKDPLPHTYTHMHISVFFSNRYGGASLAKAQAKVLGPLLGASPLEALALVS